MEQCGVSQAQQEGWVKLVLPELSVALIGSPICFNAQFLTLMLCKKSYVIHIVEKEIGFSQTRLASFNDERKWNTMATPMLFILGTTKECYKKI